MSHVIIRCKNYNNKKRNLNTHNCYSNDYYLFLKFVMRKNVHKYTFIYINRYFRANEAVELNSKTYRTDCIINKT